MNKQNRIRSEQVPFKISQLFGTNKNSTQNKENLKTSASKNNMMDNLVTNSESKSNNYNINPTYNNNNNNNFIFNSPVFKFGNENEEDKYRESGQFTSDSKQKNEKSKSKNNYF